MRNSTATNREKIEGRRRLEVQINITRRQLSLHEPININTLLLYKYIWMRRFIPKKS